METSDDDAPRQRLLEMAKKLADSKLKAGVEYDDDMGYIYRYLYLYLYIHIGDVPNKIIPGWNVFFCFLDLLVLVFFIFEYVQHFACGFVHGKSWLGKKDRNGKGGFIRMESLGSCWV